jgi:uncharacterized protein (TIGR03435 family)
MTFRLKTAGVPIFAIGLSAQAAQQPATVALRSFEVASVRVHNPALPYLSYHALPDLVGPGGRVSLQGIPLFVVLRRAFDIRADRVSAPSWLVSETYDIFASAPTDARREQYPLMFQSLLADRFGLRYHYDAPVTLVYGVAVAPGGSKLKPGLDDPDPYNYGPIRSAGGVTGKAPGRARSSGWGVYQYWSANGARHFDFENIPMKGLAGFIFGNLDLPVIDITGLKGTYQVSLDVPSQRCPTPRASEDGDQAVPIASDPCSDQYASIAASLKKQGLTLERRKLPYPRLVVDHIERVPTEN